MKILLYSNHKWTERSFPFLLQQLNRARGFDFTEIVRKPAPKNVAPFKPDGTGGLIADWDWFYETMTKPFEKEYDLIIWHEERAKGHSFQRGATRTFNGHYDTVTKDTVFNAYVFADNRASDERTRNHHKFYPNMTDFERIFIHEVAHGCARYNTFRDVTHVWDYDFHNIPGYFDTFNMQSYRTQRGIIATLKRIIGKFT